MSLLASEDILASPTWEWVGHVHFVYCLVWDYFDRHMLRSISCPRWHERRLSTLVDIHFVSSLARDMFGQHNLTYIFSPTRHEI